MLLNKPPRLQPRSMIAITAPASPIRDRAKLECGVRYLESLGYRVVIGHSVESYDGYLAGSDQLRAKELERFFTDPTIGAIFCARGGYGTTRLLELLDWEKIRRNPKIIVGFSDITALQWALLTRAAMPSLSGLMVGVDFADLDPASESLFWSLLTESELRERHVWQGTPDDCIIGGYGSGRLLPGTLTLVAALCGTPFIPPLDSNILVLEDVGEDSYRIDRMLCQLSLAGILRQCSALAFGAFTPDATLQRSTPDRPLRTIFAEYAHKAGDKPSVMNLPYGHIRGKISLPLGLWARLNADRQQLVLTEALVR